MFFFNKTIIYIEPTFKIAVNGNMFTVVYIHIVRPGVFIAISRFNTAIYVYMSQPRT